MARNFIFQRRFLQISARYVPFENLLTEIENVTRGNVFKNLDWLINEEAGNLMDHFKSSPGNPHPVVNTIRDFIENKSLSFGMTINLFSEIANAENSTKIRDKQMVMAKVTEMMRMADLLHQDIVTITESNGEMHKGNKIALLCADFLLAKCLNDLVNLKEPFYLEYMASALRDLTIGRTLGPMGKNDKIYPLKPTKSKDISNFDDFSCELIDYTNLLGNPVGEWLLRSSLICGNLLGKGCRSVLRMANAAESYQHVGFSFGKYFALSLKANQDIHDILNQSSFDFVNLVVYLHMKKHPEFHEEIEHHRNDLKAIDYKYIIRKLIEDGTLEESFDFRNTLMTSTIKTLDVFEDSRPKRLMKDLVKSLE